MIEILEEARPQVAFSRSGPEGSLSPAGELLKKNMALRLAATSDDRALVIRDHLLPIVRERGTLEVQHGAVRVITLQISGWRFVHWTPFNELSLLEASSPGYRHAVERQHTRPDLLLLAKTRPAHTVRS